MSTTTKRVRRQYEEFPYPFRDPVTEASTTRFVFNDSLDAVNHFCYRGKRDFNKDFRVLVAGGGTGDSFVFLAEQLANTDNEIVYIDLSRASSEIARKRVEAKGIPAKNYRMILGSLLDLPNMTIGKFDYINCTGVLHHLDDPSEGLHALASLLNDDGVMSLMVYGRYGRVGIYPFQKLLRMLLPDQEDMQRNVDLTRMLIDQMPPTNWFRRSACMFNIEEDTEVFDLLLHCKDRPYSFPELFEWLDGEGLRYVEMDCFDRAYLSLPSMNCGRELFDRASRLPRERRLPFSEIAWGMVRKHSFWTMKGDGDRLADPREPRSVPFFTRSPPLAAVQKGILECDDPTYAVNLALRFRPQDPAMRLASEIKLTPLVKEVIGLIDGQRTSEQIVQAAAKRQAVDASEAWDCLVELIEVLARRDTVFLRDRSVRPLRWVGDPPPVKRIPRPQLHARDLRSAGLVPAAPQAAEEPSLGKRETKRKKRRN